MRTDTSQLETGTNQFETGEDYALEMIPLSARQPLRSPLVVWIGWVFFPTGITAAITVTGSFTLSDTLWIALISCLLLGTLCAVTGTIGQREGLSFGLLSNFAFGTKGMKIPAILVPVTLWGWNAINVSVAALMMSAFFNMEHSYWLFCLVTGALYVITSIKGYKYITYLGYVAVPAIVAIMFIAARTGINTIGGWDKLMEVVPDAVGSMSMVAGLTAIVGTFAIGAGTGSPDIQRWCRSTKDSILVAIITFGVAYSYLMLTGAIASIAANNNEMVEAFRILGLLMVGAIAIFFLTWTTAVTDYYTASLGLSAALKISKTKGCLIVGCSAVALSLIRPYNYLVFWLTLMAALAVPAGGTIAADYFVCNKGKYPDIRNVTADLGETKIPEIKWAAMISWVIGFIIIQWTTAIDFGIPPLFGWVGSFVAMIVFDKIIHQPFEKITK